MKPENAGILRGDLDAAHHARFGCGRMFQKAVEQKLHAEIIAGAAEEHRRAFAREHGGVVEDFARVFEHLEFLDRSVERRVVELAAHRRIVQAADGNRRAIFAADRALEEMHLLRLPVIHAAKIRTRRRWASSPGTRRCRARAPVHRAARAGLSSGGRTCS